MNDRLTAGLILSQAFALARRGWMRALPALAVMTSIGALVDSGAVDQANASALNLLASGINVGASYWITKALLQDLAGRRLPRRIGAFIGLGILSTLAILAGFAFLVVPGIILAIRWSVSDPILLSGEESVTGAMQHSWRVTKPHFWPILIAYLAIFVPSWGLGFGAYALEDFGAFGVAPAIAANLALDAGLVAGWHAAVAILAYLEGPDRLTETFA